MQLLAFGSFLMVEVIAGILLILFGIVTLSLLSIAALALLKTELPELYNKIFGAK